MGRPNYNQPKQPAERTREMGRPNFNQSIQHFSHPHPLELSNLQQQRPTSKLPPCAACKQESSGIFYICKTCNFILHHSCSTKPQLINHPSDPNHPLTLLPFPAYPDGTFTCDACGLQDNGFCYHCRACCLDLHIHCVSLPINPHAQAANKGAVSLSSSINTSQVANMSPAHASRGTNPYAQAANINAAYVSHGSNPYAQAANIDAAYVSHGSNPYAQAANIDAAYVSHCSNPYADVTHMGAAPNYIGGKTNNGLMDVAVKGLVQGFTSSSSSDDGSTSSVVGTITSSVLQNMFGLN
ncbi:hypothetical protein NE237_021638 [Protea cynaroides]|uniref:DC1 domain-containing protein n=1 Tax=Protea cynaroides TaxID=273540 RepID=A0A9Q0K523_9MAGN|nr:hypothetical protein NE237_021638 [Protea cynaroides]